MTPNDLFPIRVRLAGRCSSSTALQPANALVPTVFSPSGRKILRRFLQPPNAAGAISLKFSPITISVSPDPIKAASFNERSERGSSIRVSASHRSKACRPMETTVSGRLISLSFTFPEKALSPIETSPSCKDTDSRASQSPNANRPISLQPPGKAASVSPLPQNK